MDIHINITMVRLLLFSHVKLNSHQSTPTNMSVHLVGANHKASHFFFVLVAKFSLVVVIEQQGVVPYNVVPMLI